eukprot:6469190-Amphidinium_carterae.1
MSPHSLQPWEQVGKGSVGPCMADVLGPTDEEALCELVNALSSMHAYSCEDVVVRKRLEVTAYVLRVAMEIAI